MHHSLAQTSTIKPEFPPLALRVFQSQGTYRAFVKLSTAGQRGRPDLAAVNTEYRRLQAQDPEALAAAVCLGSIASRPSGTNKSSTKRLAPGVVQAGIMSKNRKVQQTLALSRRTQGMSNTERCFKILEHVNAIGQSLEVALRIGNYCERQDNLQQKSKDEEDRNLLQAFQGSDGKEIVKKAISALPCLSALEGFLEPVPSTASMMCLKVSGELAKQKALETLSWSVEHVQSNLGPCLEKLWTNLHTTVDAVDPEALPEVGPRDSGKKPCLQAGICLSTPDGKQVHKFKNVCLQQMKQQFKSGEQKALLKHGHIVMHLTTEDGDPTSFPETLAPEHEEHFFHIGLMYFNPYRATLQRLVRTNKVHGDGPLADPHAFGSYLLEHQAFSLVDRKKTWSLHWWQVVRTSTVVLSVMPERIAIVRLAGGKPGLWPVLTLGRVRPLPAPTPSMEDEGMPPIDDGEVDDHAADAEEVAGESGDEAEAPDEASHPDLLDLLAEVIEANALAEHDQAEGDGVVLSAPSVTRVADTITTARTRNDDDMAGLEEEGGVAGLPGSSTDVVAPPHVALAPDTQAARSKSMCRITVGEHGELNYYFSKGSFQATCYKHAGCVLSRTSNPAKSGSNGAGRPVGFLAAWLLLGASCADKADHWNRAKWESALTHPVRVAARNDVLAKPMGEDLCAYERASTTFDVDGEPASLVGLLR
eukprot:6492137-Amphidinium_carterae.2